MESIGENRKRKVSGRGAHGGGRGIIDSNIGCSGWRNFNNSNNQNKTQELKFYPHGTGPDWQTATFTKVKENIILKTQSEFVNGSNIIE